MLGHVLEDLRPSLREVVDHAARHHRHVRDAVLHRLPLKPEPVGQLTTERRLVEKPGRLGVPVEVPGVERGPALIRALGQIADDDMGVQQRITSPRRPMLEGRADKAAALDLKDTAVATTRPALSRVVTARTQEVKREAPQ